MPLEGGNKATIKLFRGKKKMQLYAMYVPIGGHAHATSNNNTNRPGNASPLDQSSLTTKAGEQKSLQDNKSQSEVGFNTSIRRFAHSNSKPFIHESKINNKPTCDTAKKRKETIATPWSITNITPNNAPNTWNTP